MARRLSRWQVCDGVELATLIDGIKDHIGVEWKSLGRALQLNQTEVGAIEYDYRFSLKEQIFQLFHVWQMKEGEGATCEALIAALKKANLVGVLELLKGLFIVEQSATELIQECPDQGYPVQEQGDTAAVGIVQHPVQATPERPKLMGVENGVTDDSERDQPKSKPSALGPVSTAAAVSPKLPQPTQASSPKDRIKSPEDPKKRDLRIKRLIRLSSNKGPFDEGSMVKVDQFGYGVVRCIEEMKTRTGDLIAGIEFGEGLKSLEGITVEPRSNRHTQDMQDFVHYREEKPVPGGGNGDLNGTRYFSCDNGHGLFLPYEKLKKDDRFEEIQPKETLELDNSENVSLDQSSSTDSPSSKPAYADSPSSSQPGVYVFYIPNDHAGLVIGREGKNILEVERATNTIIKLDSDSVSLGSRRRGTVIGSEDNCKKAILMIAEKVSRKVSMHTAASETISVPSDKVGLIIGKGGVTVQAIKQLSGAQDIKFSERPKGLEGLESLFNPNSKRECTITGSHEEIEKAKNYIERVIAGEDVVLNALLATKLAGLSFDDESGCVVS